MSNVCIKQLGAAPEVLQSLCCHLLQGNLLLRGAASKNPSSSHGPIEFRSPKWRLFLMARTFDGWGSQYIGVHTLKMEQNLLTDVGLSVCFRAHSEDRHNLLTDDSLLVRCCANCHEQQNFFSH